MWLLNPNGIIFGAGAALDIGGSFMATTADEIQFGNSNSFSATPNTQENLALLTVVPSALFFNQMGQNHPIIVDSGALLTVSSQENIALLGRQVISNQPAVSISNSSFLQAPQGNVSIGALQSNGKIEIDEGLRLSFPANVVKNNIFIGGGSGIDVSGVGGGNISLQGSSIYLRGVSNLYSSTRGHVDGGTIDISAKNLTIAENSKISANTFGTGKGSQINISATESVNLVGEDTSAFQRLLSDSLSQSSSSIEIDSTSINSISNGDGSSGDITIHSPDLNLYDGAWIVATTTSTEQAGNIDIDVENNITLDGSGLLTAVGIGSQGNAGQLNLDSNNLLLQNGSVISSSTLGKGNGGDINLNIVNSIQLSQSLVNGAFPTSIFSNTIIGDGTAGNLTINTNQLILDDGANLSSSSGALTNNGLIPFGGNGGNIQVNATDLIQITGISPDLSFPSGIINSTFSDNSTGNIEIHTGKLNLRNEAVISASSIGTGDGGNLNIVADESIYLSGKSFEDLQNLFINGLAGEVEVESLTGGLLTNTQIGKAGNTTITSPSLILENGALISTSTFGSADGGNIDIVAQDVEVSSSLLASSTTGTGRAGNITMATERLTTTDSGLITTSSTGLGNAGNLKVDAIDFVRLVDANNRSLVSGGLLSNSLGLSYPGNLEVNTKDLTIGGGAKISASNGNRHQLIPNELGNPGISVEQSGLEFPRNVIINAESIDISGTSAHNLFISGISSATSSVFPASNINITTSNLAIANQGEISVSSFGEGKAGNLSIVADSIYLDSQGKLNATTVSGQGGNIELFTRDILALSNGSKIKTDASDFGNGGNIIVDTTFLLASGGSEMTAKALSGQCGNINIEATELFVTLDSQITASSQLGIDGEVNIKTFSTSDRHNLVKLPEKTIPADRLIVKSCGHNNSGSKKGVFSYTGRGGLPSNPLAEYYLSDRTLIPDFSLADADSSSKNPELKLGRAKLTAISKDTVEASTWKVNSQGKVELVAQIQQDLLAEFSNYSDCPFSH